MALRDCAHCQEVVYNEFTGEPTDKPRGKKPLPCQTAAGCPKGSPDAGIALSERNREAYEHYRECRAVGSFPDDAIVRRSAAIIADAEREAQLLISERESDRRASQKPSGRHRRTRHEDRRA